MNLALGIVLLWLGCALLWVAAHGLDTQNSSPGSIFAQLGKEVQKSTASGGG